MKSLKLRLETSGRLLFPRKLLASNSLQTLKIDRGLEICGSGPGHWTQLIYRSIKFGGDIYAVITHLECRHTLILRITRKIKLHNIKRNVTFGRNIVPLYTKKRRCFESRDSFGKSWKKSWFSWSCSGSYLSRQHIPSIFALGRFSAESIGELFFWTAFAQSTAQLRSKWSVIT